MGRARPACRRGDRKRPSKRSGTKSARRVAQWESSRPRNVGRGGPAGNGETPTKGLTK